MQLLGYNSRNATAASLVSNVISCCLISESNLLHGTIGCSVSMSMKYKDEEIVTIITTNKLNVVILQKEAANDGVAKQQNQWQAEGCDDCDIQND